MLSERIRELANTNGIDALGFTDASAFNDYPLINSKRIDPKLSLPDAQSVIVAGIYIGGLTLPVWSDPFYGRTSRLYLSGFFCDVVKPLELIKSFLLEQGYSAIICDSSRSEKSILPLKLAAIRAGLGWQGKHSLLISRKYGSFLALGGIITNALLEYNTKEEPNRCNKCDKCQKACPLSALEKPFVLNRKKCLSSRLQKRKLSEDSKIVMENRVGDCEICQDACPWNKKHIETPLSIQLTLSFQKEIEKWNKYFYLPDLIDLTEEKYKKVFGPLKTDIAYGVFHRNIISAMERAKKILK
jgi:epoxyqueuosine reductase